MSEFYIKRRSVLARKMSPKKIPEEDLKKILAAGIRVPDHGALNPWKIKVIQGKKLEQIDKEIILNEFKKENPNDHPKIPEWEMTLSSGAVCMNLLSCAQSLGYAAQWLTEWYAYNNKILEYLSARKDIDKISGFIYIGHKVEEPNERRRPDPKNVIDYL